MDPKCWIKLHEPKSKLPSRGVVIMTIVLFLAALSCLLLIILLQEISGLRTELANVQKELHIFNKRRENVRVTELFNLDFPCRAHEIVSLDDGRCNRVKDIAPEFNNSSLNRTRTWQKNITDSGNCNHTAYLSSNDLQRDLSETLNKQNASNFQRKEKLPGLNRNSEELRALTRRRRNVGQTRKLSFLQLRPDAERSTIQQEDSTFIPWIVASEGGDGLEKRSDKIHVNAEGYYSVYSQVLYFDNCMAMGHVVRRRKSHLFGNEQRLTTLFRCIQNMPNNTASNTCFTAGIVKLDEGDQLELLLPSRPNAHISMDGDSTFFGAMRVL